MNEDLRAQLNTVQYELETLKQEREMERLQHQQEIRDAQDKAEADFRRAQEAESANKLTSSRYEALLKELQDTQTRTANERQDLERRLRISQDKAQQLQEDADEAREDVAALTRDHEYKYNALEAQHKSLKENLDEVQADLETKINSLQTVQRKLTQKETEVGELESEILRLKTQTGDQETLALIKRELTEQVAHIKKLEALNREQHAELKQLRRVHKSIDMVEEEKRSLESKLRVADDLRRELEQSELRRQVLETERQSWTAYLENEAAGSEMQFESPEDLARAFIRERLETMELTKRLGEIKPELSVKDEIIQALEDEKAKLQAEIQKLKGSNGAVPGPGAADGKIRARLERQKALATKEVEYLRAQLKAFDIEDQEMEPGKHDAEKSARITELENLVDEYRKEVEILQKDLSSMESSPLSVAAGQKRAFQPSPETDERVGELRRKNKQLQEDLKELHKRFTVQETELKAYHTQLKALKASSRTRILELRSNPTADAEALKLSTVKTLREANAELLARLEGTLSTSSTVSLASLQAAQAEIAELHTTIAERDKRIKRLKQIWSAKALEFREAVASVLGWKMDFMPNGRARVTSMFYPGDEEGENSIMFDGENGTMKVSGGTQSAFAAEIRDNITFWVEERGEIPCLLAALTLEFWERQSNNTKSA